jgi:hypothetical protein
MFRSRVHGRVVERLQSTGARHVAIALAVVLTGCNYLTGADEFVLDGGADGDGGSSSGGVGNATSGGPSVTSSAGPGGPGATTSTGTPAPEGDATGVSITKVAFYQAVESVSFENGPLSTPSVAIVAGRPAVARVFVDAFGPTGSPITARLYLGGGAPLEVVVNGVQTSSQGNLGSTINFDIPGELIQPGAKWSVELKESAQSSQGANPNASTGEVNLGVQNVGTLKVTLIPVQYQADGSNRLPDTSAGQVEGYRQLFMAMYPTSSVQIAVASPYGWNQTVSASGNGWDTLLNAISNLRSSSSADFDEFYYGIFEPSGSFSSFCGGGCVSGLGFIGDPNGEYSRAAIGLGYPGGVAFETAVHEIGHNHGRPHSPCGGVSGADGNYPYAGGSVGVWGMNILSKELITPQYKDLMGYCSPIWISDYVYEDMMSFSQAISGQQLFVPPEAMNQTYERVAFGPAGTTFLEASTLVRPPMGPTLDVDVVDASGQATTLEGTVYRYDHLDGGVVLVKRPTSSPLLRAKLRTVLGGSMKTLEAVR